MYSVFIFGNTSLVFYAQNILDKERIEYEIIPTPKVDKVCCGICIKVSAEMKEQVEKVLYENNVEVMTV